MWIAFSLVVGRIEWMWVNVGCLYVGVSRVMLVSTADTLWVNGEDLVVGD